MSTILRPNGSVLFMKIGIHAQETFEEIIKRMLREIEDAGQSFWGYGGNTCHPTSMVQPFASDRALPDRPIHLVMEKMTSNHFAEPLPADEYSIDGRKWQPVPDGIEVRGSRYALVIDDLKEVDLRLPLGRTRVAVGPSIGRSGRKYVAGRVDKACLDLNEDIAEPISEEESTPIGLVATLKAPYAVFLRNKP